MFVGEIKNHSCEVHVLTLIMIIIGILVAVILRRVVFGLSGISAMLS